MADAWRSLDPAALRERFDNFMPLVRAEAVGLTQPQLDWASDHWSWSTWSIRRQLTHMTAVGYGWLCTRWGAQLYPTDLPKAFVVLDSMKPQDRLAFYSSIDAAALLAQLDHSVRLAHDLLHREPPASFRERTLTLRTESLWSGIEQGNATGIEREQPGMLRITLETTLRHMYFELVTHLYNIVRLKHAQGLGTTIAIPREGYWLLPDWDRSEP
ncbi:MAG: hypothetical protein HY261_04880 [Chloroflexi bacterium]|nr:hypothetical protein [Chloroflexota bacterium]